MFTQAMTAAIISLISELIAQFLSGSLSKCASLIECVDWMSVRNQFIIGFFLRGAPVYLWYRCLTAIFRPFEASHAHRDRAAAAATRATSPRSVKIDQPEEDRLKEKAEAEHSKPKQPLWIILVTARNRRHEDKPIKHTTQLTPYMHLLVFSSFSLLLGEGGRGPTHLRSFHDLAVLLHHRMDGPTEPSACNPALQRCGQLCTKTRFSSASELILPSASLCVCRSALPGGPLVRCDRGPGGSRLLGHHGRELACVAARDGHQLQVDTRQPPGAVR